MNQIEVLAVTNLIIPTKTSELTNDSGFGDVTNKVDKVTGKELSKNDLTDALISTWNGKQDALGFTAEVAGTAAGLISDLKNNVSTNGDTLKKLYDLFVNAFSEVSVANITARNAIDIVTGNHVFVLDDGDGKWALYKATTSGVNATYVKLSDPDLLNVVMSASAIKSAYESNTNTNCLTDTLKTAYDGAVTNSHTSGSDNQDLSGLALKTNVLQLDNTTAFTPDADYEPATKKYVDDLSSSYTLPTATDTVLGGVKIGSGVTITNGVISVAGGASPTLQSIGDLVNTATEKDTPIDADEIPYMDSAASNILKKLSWSNLKAKLKAYFDGIYSSTKILIAIKTADQAVNNSTTLVDCTDLSVTLVANSTYVLEIALLGANAGNSVQGLKLGFISPTGSTGNINTMANGSISNISVGNSSNLSLFFAGSAWNLASANTNIMVRINGIIQTSSTPDVLKLQFAQNSAYAYNTSVLKGSYMKLIKV